MLNMAPGEVQLFKSYEFKQLIFISRVGCIRRWHIFKVSKIVLPVLSFLI